MPTKLGEEYTYLDEVAYFWTNGEFVPFKGLAEVTMSEPVEEDRNVTLRPEHSTFTATMDISSRQLNKIHRMLNKIRKRGMRIARYHKRLRERIRRGKLKGRDIVRIGRPYYLWSGVVTDKDA